MLKKVPTEFCELKRSLVMFFKTFLSTKMSHFSKLCFTGPISMGQVLTIQPFKNVIDIIRIKGQYIWDAFEHSVANYDPHDRPGAFFQVSGKRLP